MKNNNALISMAIVSQNANDPFYVFSEYIKYCIFSYADNMLTISKLKELIENEFDIIIPNHIIIHCLKTVVNEGWCG